MRMRSVWLCSVAIAMLGVGGCYSHSVEDERPLTMLELEPDPRESIVNELGVQRDPSESIVTQIDDTPPGAGAQPAEREQAESGSIIHQIEPDGPRVLMGIGAGRTRLPETGIGFARPSGGGAERFAGAGPVHLDTMTAAISLLMFSSHGWSLLGGASYTWGDEQRGFDVPFGGDDTGFVYGGLSPEGSSGLNAGDLGSSGVNGIDLETWTFEAKAIGPSRPVGARGEFRPFAFASYTRGDRRHSGSIAIDAFGQTLTQRRDQGLNDDIFGVGFGGLYRYDLGGGGGLNLYGAAGLQHRSSELRSVEMVDCALCGGQDTLFDLRFDETDDALTYSLAAGLKWDFPVTDKVSLSLGADAAYLDEVGAVFNPQSGDQVFFEGRTTSLESGHAWTWNIGFGAIVRY